MLTSVTRSGCSNSKTVTVQLPSVRTAMVNAGSPPLRELAIFDGRLKNLEQLLAGLRPGVEAVVLIADANGIDQISSWLNTHHLFDAVHIFAMGESGRLQLGSATLSLETLPQYRLALNRWRQHLRRDGIVQLYSGQLGAAPHGDTFLKKLSQVLSVTIAASRYPLGKGRWQLDLVYGDASVALPLQRTCLETYNCSL